MPEVRTFVSAMVQADAFGIPIAQVLRVQSTEIRVKRRQRAEEKAQQVPVKITIPLIFTILPCLFIAVMGPAVDQHHGQLRLMSRAAAACTTPAWRMGARVLALADPGRPRLRSAERRWLVAVLVLAGDLVPVHRSPTGCSLRRC